ncbi:MAG: helix-turn-helix domain-containing protein [Planctomycetota bacterium]|jgi:excisionase family DNA binding protein
MLLTVGEVAKRLNVSVGCVYALVAKNEISHVRIGVGRGTIRLRQEDLDDYLEARQIDKRERAAQVPPHPTLRHLKL